jgi:hypothetical protein
MARLNSLRKKSKSIKTSWKFGDLKLSNGFHGSLLSHPGAICFFNFQEIPFFRKLFSRAPSNLVTVALRLG